MEQNPSIETTGLHNNLKQWFFLGGRQVGTKIKELWQIWNEKTSTLNLDQILADWSKPQTRTLLLFMNPQCWKSREPSTLGGKLLAKVFEIESTIKVSPQKKEVRTQLHSQLHQQANNTPLITLAELNKAISRLKDKKGWSLQWADQASWVSCQTEAAWALQPIREKSYLSNIMERNHHIPTLKKDWDPKKKTNYWPISLLSWQDPWAYDQQVLD